MTRLSAVVLAAISLLLAGPAMTADPAAKVDARVSVNDKEKASKTEDSDDGDAAKDKKPKKDKKDKHENHKKGHQMHEDGSPGKSERGREASGEAQEVPPPFVSTDSREFQGDGDEDKKKPDEQKKPKSWWQIWK